MKPKPGYYGLAVAVVVASFIVIYRYVPGFTTAASALAALAVSILSVFLVYAQIPDPPVLQIREITFRGDRVVAVVRNQGEVKANGCRGKVDVVCGWDDFLPAGHTGGLPVFITRENADPGDIRAAPIVWERAPYRDVIDIVPDDEETLLIARTVRIPEPAILVYSEEGEARAPWGTDAIGSRGRAIIRAKQSAYRVTLHVGADNLPKRLSYDFLMEGDPTTGNLAVKVIGPTSPFQTFRRIG